MRITMGNYMEFGMENFWRLGLEHGLSEPSIKQEF